MGNIIMIFRGDPGIGGMYALAREDMDMGKKLRMKRRPTSDTPSKQFTRASEGISCGRLVRGASPVLAHKKADCRKSA